MQPTYPHPHSHMVIRIINNKPVLLVPKVVFTAQKEQKIVNNMANYQSQKHSPRSYLPSACHQSAKTSILQPNQSIQNLSIRNSDPNGKDQSVENSKILIKKEQNSDKKQSRRSIINDLMELSQQKGKSVIIDNMPHHLSSFDLIETNSFHQEDSYDFEDNQSEVIELTEEERQYFNNFIKGSPTKNEGTQLPFTTLKLKPSIGHQRTQSCGGQNMPKNKIGVIRNFFRSKGSMIKDEKTCCSSHIYTEQFMKKGKNKLEQTSEVEMVHDKPE